MTIMFFPNGNTAVCNPEQVFELQEPWVTLFLENLLKKGVSEQDLLKADIWLPAGGATLFKTHEGRLNWRLH